MSLPSLSSLGELHGWNLPLLVLLAKATVILVVAFGVTIAMQRASAGARHLVWLVSLAALVLMPALTAWAPLRLEILPAREAPAADAAPAPASDWPTTAPVTGQTSAAGVAPAGVAPAPAAAIESPSRLRAAIADSSLGSVLLAIWGTVAITILLSLAWSAFTVRRLVRRSRTLDDQSWLTPLWEVSDRLGLEEPPRLLLSEDAKMPFACGLATPTIVLPSECESWSHDRRLAVLLHELAHVRRRDLAGHTLGRIVCAVYWFHPLVWTAARQLRSESERACDDLALSCGTRATDYAEHLLEIVTSVRRERTPMVALAMARRKEFEGRMLAILDPEIRRATPSRKQSAALIGTFASMAVLVGATVPTQAVAAPRAAVKQVPQVKSAWSTQTAADTGRRDRAHDDARIARAVHEIEKSTVEATTRGLEHATDSAHPDGLVSHMVQSIVPSVLGTTLGLSKEQQRAVGEEIRLDMKGQKLSIGISGASGASSVKAADDRPDLLAKVLRSDTSASLRRVAAWGLAEFAERTVAAEALAHALRRDPSESVREMAAWSLGEGNDLSVPAEALRAALRSDASVAVRRTAAWALGEIEDQGSIAALTAALGDASPEVRTRAIWAIGQIEPRQAPKPLQALLADKDPRVREMVAWALFQIEDPESAPALQAALRTETDKDLQLAYIRALATMGEKSVDAIRGLLESPDPKIKSMAIHALAGKHANGPWPRPMPMPRPNP